MSDASRPYAKLAHEPPTHKPYLNEPDAASIPSAKNLQLGSQSRRGLIKPASNPKCSELGRLLGCSCLDAHRELPVGKVIGLGGRFLPSAINEEDWEKYLTKIDLLFPVGTRKFRWDLFMLVLILYSAVTVPFRLGMSHPATGSWWYVEVVVSLFFLTDLCLNFKTAYLDGDQYILDKQKICVNYLRGWFVIDFTSSLPLELIDAMVAALQEDHGRSASNGTLKVFRALRLVRLLRLLRLLKIQRYINIIEEALNVNLQILNLAKLLSGIVYLMHVLGCAWYFIASAMGAQGIPTWLDVYDSGSGQDADVWTQYLYSIYWALATLTTVGYGDLVPQNNAERCFALAVLLMGALVFGLMLSSVGELVNNADQNAVLIEKKMDEIKVYLRWHRFKPELAGRVRRYYEFYFSRKSAMDEEDIVSNLAPTLRRSVQIHLLGKSVARIPVFASERAYVTLDLQLKVYGLLKPLLREAKEAISESLEKGAVGGPSVYFVRRGTLEAQGSLAGVSLFEVDASTAPGTMLSEHALMASARCECTYRAKTRCELHALAVDELYDICSRMELEHVDDMARTIYAEYARRKMLRSLALRFICNAKGVVVEAGRRKEDMALLAALRLQTRWLRAKAFRCGKERAYRVLLPGLYQPANEFRCNDDHDHVTTEARRSPPPWHHTSSEAESVAVLGPELGALREQNITIQAQLAKLEQRVAELPTLEELSEVINRAVRDAVVGVDVEARVASQQSLG